MAKYKMKTKSSVAKRFKKTGSGKLKRAQGFRSHKASHKTQKQKRNLRKSALVHPSDQKRIESLLQN